MNRDDSVQQRAFDTEHGPVRVAWHYQGRAPVGRTYDQWVRIGDRKIVFDAEVREVVLAGKRILVRTGPSATESNLHCFDGQGRRLWTAQPPIRADGRPVDRVYLLHTPARRNDAVRAYVLGVFPPRHKDDPGGIDYDLDPDTGRIRAVREPERD